MKLSNLFILPLALATSMNISRRETRNQITDRYMFFTPLDEFLEIRKFRIPKALNWLSHACHDLPRQPFGFPFGFACQRHDFGYFNYKHQERFTKGLRFRIDHIYRRDLLSLCHGDPEIKATRACHALAMVYFALARSTGWVRLRWKENHTDEGLFVRGQQEIGEESKIMYYKAVTEFKKAIALDYADGLLSLGKQQFEAQILAVAPPLESLLIHRF